MQMSNTQLEAIVKQVLDQLSGSAPAANVVASKAARGFLRQHMLQCLQPLKLLK